MRFELFSSALEQLLHFKIYSYLKLNRHPELVSGSKLSCNTIMLDAETSSA